MSEENLLAAWSRVRTQLIIAQLAPTFLLITTVGLIPSIRSAGTATIVAVLGILLASGILGALAEYGAAADAKALASDLQALPATSHAAQSAIAHAKWMWVPQFATPLIFVAIFIALVMALLG